MKDLTKKFDEEIERIVNLVKTKVSTFDMQKSYNARRAYYGDTFETDFALNNTSDGNHTLVSENHLRAITKVIHNITTQQAPTFSPYIEGTIKHRDLAMNLTNTILNAELEGDKFTFPYKVFEATFAYLTLYVYMGWKKNYSTGKGEIVKHIIYPENVIVSKFSECDFSKQRYVAFSVHRNKRDVLDELIEAGASSKLIESFYENYSHINETNSTTTTNEATFYENEICQLIYYFERPSSFFKKGRAKIFMHTGEELFTETGLPNNEIPMIQVTTETRIESNIGHSIVLDLLSSQQKLDIIASKEATLIDKSTEDVWLIESGSVNKTTDEDDGKKMFIGNEFSEKITQPTRIEAKKIDPQLQSSASRTVSSMEQLAGLNQLTRGGQLPANISGTAMAIATAASQTNNGGVELSWRSFVKKYMEVILHVYIGYADESQLAMILPLPRGVKAKSLLKSISEIKLSEVAAASKTFSGRLAMVEPLMASGALTKEQFMDVISGKEPTSIFIQSNILTDLIDNNRMMILSGKMPIVTAYDNHPLHIMEYGKLFALDEVRNNIDLQNLIIDVIKKHEETEKMAQQNIPEIIATIRGQPLAPPPAGIEAPPAEINAQEIQLSEETDKGAKLDKLIENANNGANAKIDAAGGQ